MRRMTMLPLLASALAANAQTTPPRPPPDLLPVIQMTQMMVGELKAVCLAAHPELADMIEQAHREWILYPVKIVVQVNDRDYVSPTLTAMQALVRNQFAAQDKDRLRRDCEEFRQGLNKMLATVPKEALAPFLTAPQGK
jgi:hypothetical protein